MSASSAPNEVRQRGLTSAPVIADVRRQVTSPELLQSWKRTEGLLLDARAHLSQEAQAICDSEIHEFHAYLEHNELGLAFESLAAAFEKSGFESWRVLELLAVSAASMQLFDRQREFDGRLSEARGWKYETVLRQNDTQLES